jgi:hypothetical protein
MYFLGHLGIGHRIARPLGLPVKWVLLGTVFPDLIDKPLYYALSFATGLKGAELGLISGSRTFAHMAVFMGVLSLGGVFARSDRLKGFAIGVATHCFLDHLPEYMGGVFWYGFPTYGPGGFPLPDWWSDRVAGVLFPFMGLRFTVNSFQSAAAHLFSSVIRPHMLIGEILGAVFLFQDFIMSKWLRAAGETERTPRES